MLPGVSLSHIYRLLRTGGVRVNGRKAAPGARIQAGDLIEVPGSEQVTNGGVSSFGSDLAWVHSSEELLVINKPAGLATHGGTDSVAARVASLPGQPESLSFHPAPVHRLDRPTSGALLVARSLRAARELSARLRDHGVTKWYVAVVAGKLDAPHSWNDPLTPKAVGDRSVVGGGAASRTARLAVTPLAKAATGTLVLVDLHTGLTHQIRAQLAAHGHPLVGDRNYGRPAAHELLLHCATLQFHLPLECAIPRGFVTGLWPWQTRLLDEWFGSGRAATIIQRIRSLVEREEPLDASLLSHRLAD